MLKGIPLGEFQFGKAFALSDYLKKHLLLMSHISHYVKELSKKLSLKSINKRRSQRLAPSSRIYIRVANATMNSPTKQMLCRTNISEKM